jgi:hypothetical protein
MTEILYKKRRNNHFVSVMLYAFDTARDNPNSEDLEKVDRLIEIQMNKHGWYKTEW